MGLALQNAVQTCSKLPSNWQILLEKKKIQIQVHQLAENLSFLFSFYQEVQVAKTPDFL